MVSTNPHLFICNGLSFMNEQFYINEFRNEPGILNVRCGLLRNTPVFGIIDFDTEKNQKDFFEKYKNKQYSNLNNIPIELSFEMPQGSHLILYNDHEFKFQYEYHKFVDTQYSNSPNYPGLVLGNQDIINRFSKALMIMIKNIGTTVIKGLSIMNISLPVIIFDKRTLLQTIAYEFAYAPFYLEKAALISDPFERLKITSQYFFASLHLAVFNTKPFNPILGETFSVEIGLNTKVYLEQTEHKPPISHFYVLGKGYKITGYLQVEASTGANSIKAIKKGKFLIKFNDGILHQIEFPTIEVKGTTVGTLTFNHKNSGLVYDQANNLATIFKFNPDEKSMLGKMFFSQKTLCDYVKGQFTSFDSIVFKSDNKHELIPKFKNLGTLEGNWTKQLTLNSEKFWDKNEALISSFYYPKIKIPSESDFREDLKFMIEGNEDLSQVAKEKLENIQRNDRKLREKYSNENKK